MGRIIEHLGLKPDYEALYAAENFTCKADLKRPGLSVECLRFICGKEGVDTVDSGGGNIGRTDLETALAADLEKKLPGFSIKRQKKV